MYDDFLLGPGKGAPGEAPKPQRTPKEPKPVIAKPKEPNPLTLERQAILDDLNDLVSDADNAKQLINLIVNGFHSAGPFTPNEFKTLVSQGSFILRRSYFKLTDTQVSIDALRDKVIEHTNRIYRLETYLND